MKKFTWPNKTGNESVLAQAKARRIAGILPTYGGYNWRLGLAGREIATQSYGRGLLIPDGAPLFSDTIRQYVDRCARVQQRGNGYCLRPKERNRKERRQTGESQLRIAHDEWVSLSTGCHGIILSASSSRRSNSAAW
jgi:hypothetical protein